MKEEGQLQRKQEARKVGESSVEWMKSLTAVHVRLGFDPEFTGLDHENLAELWVRLCSLLEFKNGEQRFEGGSG